MTSLEQLYDYAYNNNIVVENHYYDSKTKGFAAKDCDNSLIFLNDKHLETDAERYCVLAEELGHIETDALLPVEDYIDSDYRKWLKRKNEILAKRWAIEKILPIDTLQKALKICDNDYDAAEECSVSVEFLQMALQYYRNKSLI